VLGVVGAACIKTSYEFRTYTESDSKIGILTRRRPEFESGEASAEEAQLE
jgi:hypothetical protein